MSSKFGDFLRNAGVVLAYDPVSAGLFADFASKSGINETDSMRVYSLEQREPSVSNERRHMPRTTSHPVARDAASDDAPPSVESSIGFADLTDHRDALVRLAYRFVWSREDAEDVVHDALLSAHRNRSRIRDRDRLAAWLRSIVVRRCQDLNRTRQRHRKAHRWLSLELNMAAAPAPPIEQADEHARLRAAIASLPARQQSALVLRDLEQLSYREAADAMEIAESTVRVLVRNARDALREKLKTDDK